VSLQEGTIVQSRIMPLLNTPVLFLAEMRQACVRRRRRSHSHICTTIGWCSVGEVIKMHHSPEVLNDTNHTLGCSVYCAITSLL